MSTAYGVLQQSQNLALNKPATGSSPCTSAETPAQAVNGSYSQGLDDKFCSLDANPYLQVDLGSPVAVSRFIVEHAGAGGESLALNSVAFNIQVSTDGVNFLTVVDVTGNTFSITTHDIAPQIARYVRLNVTTPTETSDAAMRIYEFQVFASGGGLIPDFSLSLGPTAQTVSGAAAMYTVTTSALSGFGGRVALTASGLPAGLSVSLNPAVIQGSGSSQVTITTSSSIPPGTYSFSITGTSGVLQHMATATLTIAAPAPVTSLPVSLSSVYNGVGIVTDGSTFAGTSGVDRSGHAYSANLLASTQTFNGARFSLGLPNTLNFVTGAIVTLPAGRYTTLNLLATGVNGNQPSQTFTVTYTDGTTSTFTQSLSDWFTPQGYSGETTLLAMPHRDLYDGTEDNRTFNVYAYSFALNRTRMVRSITLPANNNVVVLAITLSSRARARR
jgi:F5/8 type C domain